MYSRLHKRLLRVRKRLIGLPPATKLTAGYLAIIMTLSIGFSVVLFQISANQLHRGLRRPAIGVDAELPQFFDLYERTRLQQIFSAESELRSNLVLFNIFVLLAGGGASYVLAKRTIRPIEEALEAQKRFTADASHELRTPLTAMQTEIEVALRDPRLKPSEARALLQSNLDEVVRVQLLVEGLLRLARKGELDIRKRVKIADPMKAAMKRVRQAAQQNHVSLKLDAPAARVAIDPGAIEEVLVILLDNAIKYGPQNSTVSLKAHQERDTLVLEVRDQGEGIADEDLPHLFERFYRGDKSRTKQSVEGFGLGLSIAKQIIEAHKGSIQAASSVEGTVFSVRLPQA